MSSIGTTAEIGAEEHETLKIARVVHESVRAIKQSQGDHSLPGWDDAESWHKESTVQAVEAIASNPDMGSEHEHHRWMEEKFANGWSYGPVRSDENKTHPLLVPYDQLPPLDREKNAIIVSVVRTMMKRNEDATLLKIAMAVHEMNRAWCEINSDFSQVPWAEAPEWQRKASIDGIKYIMEHPQVSPGFQHVQWMQEKLADGWKYGPVKDPAKKEHPMLIPFEQLPWDEQIKDAIFITTAKMLLKLENRTFIDGS